jgi:hypothetical protein
VLDLWINGVNQIHVTNANHFLHSYGDHIIGFRMGHNTNSNTFSGEYPIDFDDIVVRSTTPSNVDAQGRPMIGPLGWGGSGDTTPPANPSGLSVS